MFQICSCFFNIKTFRDFVLIINFIVVISTHTVHKIWVAQWVTCILEDNWIVIQQQLSNTSEMIVHFVKTAGIVSCLKLVVDFVDA